MMGGIKSKDKAVKELVNIIGQEADHLVGKALKKSRQTHAPETEPKIEEVDVRIGSSNHYERVKKILAEIDLENYADDYEKYRQILIRHYLSQKLERTDVYQFDRRNPDPDTSYFQHPLPMIIKKLDESDIDWSQEFVVSKWGEYDRSTDKIWIYHFTDNAIKDIQDRLKDRLSDELNPYFRKALISFPADFSVHFNGGFGHFNLLYDIVLHENTHYYLHKTGKVGGRFLNAMDEACAQFVGRYASKTPENGSDKISVLEEDVSAEEFDAYDNPDLIAFLYQVYQESSKYEYEYNNAKVVDHVRTKTKEFLESGKYHNRVEFLKFMTPDVMQEEIQKFEEITSHDLERALKDARRELRRLKEGDLMLVGTKTFEGDRRWSKLINKTIRTYSNINTPKEIHKDIMLKSYEAMIEKKAGYDFFQYRIRQEIKKEAHDLLKLKKEAEELEKMTKKAGIDEETEHLEGLTRELGKVESELEELKLV